MEDLHKSASMVTVTLEHEGTRYGNDGLVQPLSSRPRPWMYTLLDGQTA